MKTYIYGWLTAMFLLTASCGKETVAPEASPVDPTPGGGTANPAVSVYLTKAKETNNYIISNFLTAYKSYRVNTTTNIKGIILNSPNSKYIKLNLKKTRFPNNNTIQLM